MICDLECFIRNPINPIMVLVATADALCSSISFSHYFIYNKKKKDYFWPVLVNLAYDFGVTYVKKTIIKCKEKKKKKTNQLF